MLTGAWLSTVVDHVYRNISCGQDATPAPPAFNPDDGSSATAEQAAATAGDDAEQDIPSS